MELFTVGVISFNNLKYFEESIQSVLSQDYPMIQLIISDDASDDYFDYDIDKIVSKCKRDNIVDIVINHNEHNLGTVKHLETLKPLIKGDYVTFIAADDAFYDERVISSFYEAFHLDDERYSVISSHAGMYDENLHELKGMFNTEEDVAIVNNGGRKEILEQLCWRCFLPAVGTAYKTNVYNRITDLSKDYRYIEDWTSFIRLARMEDIEFYFIDRINAKHRDGGISHHKAPTLNVILYGLDLLNGFHNEICPIIETFPEDIKNKAISQNDGNIRKVVSDIQKYYTTRTQLEIAQQKIVQLEKEISNIKKSKSWRMTNPIRNLNQLLHGKKKLN